MTEPFDSSNERNNYRARLIALVRASALLWNKKSLDFNNRAEKVQRWLEISKTLGVSTDRIRRTWENLRDQYRRDLKRQLKYGTKSKWRFFNDMQFIRSMVRIKDITADNSGSDSEHDDSNYNRPINLLSVQMGTPASTHADLSPLLHFQPIQLSTKWNEEFSSRPQHNSQLRADANLQSNGLPQEENNKCDSSDDAKYDGDFREPPDIVKIETDTDSDDEMLTEQSPRIINCPLEETSETCVSTSGATSNDNKRRRMGNIENTEIVKNDNVTQQTQDCETQDEDYHFVMSILPTLRQVQRYRKFPLRMKIMSIISAELNDVENSPTCA